MATYYAQVKMAIVRQVEFEASPNDDLDAIAERVAISEYGDCEELEIVELDLAAVQSVSRPTLTAREAATASREAAPESK